MGHVVTTVFIVALALIALVLVMELSCARDGLGVDAAWLIAIALSIVLAPLALAWCVVDRLRTIRRNRTIQPDLMVRR